MGWEADPEMYCSVYTSVLPRLDTRINIFLIAPLPDLRPDLETSGYSAFAYMFGFPKFQITTDELWCLVVWYSFNVPLCVILTRAHIPHICYILYPLQILN